ncbi:helix-turn-helix domain-containing protein [Simiduia curdlanivorans]|uniref:Helix-turn-helix domain-containing protein n=1 Tax=Simiduia curdlanivorans TaxID=1492769 RepID=A0ABV8V2K6_9GAMM
MKLEEAFGLVLKRARSEMAISQEFLALNSGLDRTFISLLERGQRQPSLSSIVSLSTSLDISPQELVKQTMECFNENNSSRSVNK